MIVDYDDSSDEDTRVKVTNKTIPPPPSQNPTVNKATQPVQGRSRRALLPDVNVLLDCIPSSSLLVYAKEDVDEEAEMGKKNKFETYNHVAPPSFSMTEDAEFMDKAMKHKRKLPESYKNDKDCPVMDKYINTYQSAPNMIQKQQEMIAKQKEKDDRMIDIEVKKSATDTNSSKNNLVPTQRKIKRKNIAVE